MDDNLGIESESTDTKSYTELFNEAIPFFLNIGVSYDDFWYGDVEITRAYYQAYLLEEEHKQRETDTLAWLVGSYVAEAIGCTFGKSKYPKKPHSYTDNSMENSQLSEEKRAEMWMNMFESSHRDLPPTN